MLTGCEPRWIERYEPTTQAERVAVLAHAEKILAATPHTLSGHDQDWDDAITEAHRQARRVVCVPTYWEIVETNATGRYRYAQEVK